MKKFICTVCGYIHEGDAAPEKCPLCKAPASKFNEMVETEGGLEFADQHVIGVAKGCDEEMIKDLNNHFMGECTEVGMYLAMSRQADREGYPEVAEAFKRYAWEEAEHAAKFAELLGDCVWDTKTNLEKRMNAESGACADKKRIATRAKALNLEPQGEPSSWPEGSARGPLNHSSSMRAARPSSRTSPMMRSAASLASSEPLAMQQPSPAAFSIPTSLAESPAETASASVRPTVSHRSARPTPLSMPSRTIS